MRPDRTPNGGLEAKPVGLDPVTVQDQGRLALETALARAPFPAKTADTEVETVLAEPMSAPLRPTSSNRHAVPLPKFLEFRKCVPGGLPAYGYTPAPVGTACSPGEVADRLKALRC